MYVQTTRLKKKFLLCQKTASMSKETIIYENREMYVQTTRSKEVRQLCQKTASMSKETRIYE